MRKCLAASRELVDMYFLPQHLAMAAEIEAHLRNFDAANSYYEEAEGLVESMLLNVSSAEVKASLIATMDQVFRGHLRLALEDEKSMPGAFRILEQVRGRVRLDTQLLMTLCLPTAARSEKLDFSESDLTDEDELNDILWLAIKGTPSPAPARSRFAQ